MTRDNYPLRIWALDMPGGGKYNMKGPSSKHVEYVRADAVDEALAALKAVYPHIETSADGEEATKTALATIAKLEGRS